jgi:hypothetical protein
MIRAIRSARSRGNGGTNTRSLTCFYLYWFCKYVSYGFPIIHFYNPGVPYEMNVPVPFSHQRNWEAPG